MSSKEFVFGNVGFQEGNIPPSKEELLAIKDERRNKGILFLCFSLACLLFAALSVGAFDIFGYLITGEFINEICRILMISAAGTAATAGTGYSCVGLFLIIDADSLITPASDEDIRTVEGLAKHNPHISAYLSAVRSMDRVPVKDEIRGLLANETVSHLRQQAGFA